MLESRSPTPRNETQPLLSLSFHSTCPRGSYSLGRNSQRGDFRAKFDIRNFARLSPESGGKGSSFVFLRLFVAFQSRVESFSSSSSTFPFFFPPSLLFFLFSLDHDGRLDWKKLRFRFRELSRTTFSSSPVLECELTRKGMIVSLRGESITIVTFLEYRCRAYKTFHRDFNCFHRSSPSNDLFINVNWKLLDRCCVKKSSEGSSYKSSTFSSMNYKLYFNILQWYNSTKYPAISVE